MKTLTFLGLLLIISAYSIQAGQQGYPELKRQAEAYYSDASYSKAHELYEQAAALTLAPDDARWVAFRVADTEWRAQAATNTSDQSKFDDARSRLESITGRAKRPEDRDTVWAEAEDSLGDFWWTRRYNQNWGMAWQNYQKALDWWSGSKDIDAARDRYLRIVWKMAEPTEDYQYSYYYYSYVPQDVLENAVKIARSDVDKAHAHLLLALWLRNQGGLPERRRVPAEFEAALAPGKTAKWYDRALYSYGEWLTNQGPMTLDSNHQWRQQPDYRKALEIFQKLVASYRKGESKFLDAANQMIEGITKPTVGISIGNVYLPGSEIQFGLNWRNVSKIDLSIYKVDLIRDIEFDPKDSSTSPWIQRIATAGKEKTKSWSKEVIDKRDYQPGQENITLDQKLPVGAYLVEAVSGAATARDLILVTDAGIVTKTSKSRGVIYFCNASDGSPLANAEVKVWWVEYKDGNQVWHDLDGRTNQDGIANFALTADQYTAELLATAELGDRQAFSLSARYYYNPNSQPWRIYAYTDRPAYRPGETVQWKFVARQYDGEAYSTPANQTLKFRITDPHNSVVKEGNATLNQFGSAWGSLELGASLPLGEYHLYFNDEENRQVGDAALFRLEEYKLPEFKVAVKTPEENGRKKTYRLGDKVEVNIHADYYFGGPVANASVEVLVYQNPYYRYWTRPRKYSWYYEEPGYQQNYGARNGQVVKHETLTTDATGKAVLTFDTPEGNQQDFQYTIEARVTDASRREIVAEDNVRVTRQSYYVYPEAKHNIYQPQDNVGIDIKALDANDQPVQVEGKVKVTRDYWFEVWLDPSGREVKGDELKQLRARSKVFPPPPARPDQKPWQLLSNGYEHEDVLSQTLKTDKDGNAEFTFKPAKEGYYHVAWTSADSDSLPISADTTVWVATGSTTDLGYHYGGLQILADKDTFRAGQTAPVMLVAPASDRYVLFSTEANDIYNVQLVHLTGNVKVINLPVTEKDVPNIFLSAAMVSGGQLFVDSQQVVVPPVDQFLSVDVKADRAEYQPRDEATLTVTTRNARGNPVPAEVSLGIVDASVFYIQKDYAGDPRKFYYGEKRGQHVETISSFQQRAYVELEREKKDDGGFETLQKLHDLQKPPPPPAGAPNVSFTGGVSDLGGYGHAEFRIDSNGGLSSIGGFARRVDIAAMDGLKKEDAPPGGRDFKQLMQLVPGTAGGKPEVEANPAGAPAVRVRHDFRSTAVWRPDVVTDQNGKATVKVKMPESLTTWTATARAFTAESIVGIGNSETRTNEPMVVRLEGPRFFVVGDTATVSAVINNNTDSPIHAGAMLGAEGLQVTAATVAGSQNKPDAQAPVDVPPHGEARVDWTVKVESPGLPRLRVVARSETYSDAMERSFIAYEHGLDKFVSRSGKVRGNGVAVNLDIPAARKKDSTTMTVQISPSMATTLLDSLPYLIDYPYGCTEQTMSRFLPAAITTKTLKDLGLRPEDVAGRIFGGIEPSTAAQTHPEGAKDLNKLESMTKESLSRLYGFQHDDGGWGWWKEDSSDHFMTAYVVWGLSLARTAGIDVDLDRLKNAVKYLDDELVKEESNYDEQAWMIHALAAYHASDKDTAITEFQTKAFNNLWTNRAKLNAYTRALLALAAHDFEYKDKARILIDNLENGVIVDRAPDRSVIQIGAPSANASVIPTAHWGEDGVYWRWSEGGVEATAWALRALLAIDPKNRLVEPVANWLIKNRRGAQWNNTRDTAICVLSLDDYLTRTGELKPDSEYELSVNGQIIADRKLTPVDALAAPARFEIPADAIRDGSNDIRINRKAGTSPIYFAASAQYFSLEEPVTAAGNEIFARRDYYKLVARPTLLKGDVYEREPLRDGDTVTSGDRIETVITVESKNNYEYLMFEDLKPAGFEAVGVQSDTPLYAREVRSDAINRKYGEGGDQPPTPSTRRHAVVGAGIETDNGANPDQSAAADTTWRTVSVHQELRDRKVALFIGKLPQGVWEIRYDLRAEVPGSFHALPVTGGAMYVPEIRCNGTEVRVKVEDKK